jgi:hypothetical protein
MELPAWELAYWSAYFKIRHEEAEHHRSHSNLKATAKKEGGSF